MKRNSFIQEIKKSVHKYKIKEKKDIKNGYKKDYEALRSDWKKVGL